MANAAKQSSTLAEPDAFVPVADLTALRKRGVMVVKQGRKQIALFHRDGAVHACNNRCPHEGYPLSEGVLTESASGACLLTCNWHNWKFDLDSGETLVGGDRLRRYPVKVADGQVWLDLRDPPAEARAAAALQALAESFPDHETDRMAREVARLMRAGRDPLDAVCAAIVWTHDKFEFGTTHAHGAAPDWLDLMAWKAGADPALNLVPPVEIVAHLSWDSLRQPAFPYLEGSADYDPKALATAIEAEDEAAACAQVRGALRQGLGFVALEPVLASAAFAHYADFGHSAIYTLKTGQLIERLGAEVAEPLLLTLVRSLVYATREDLIPEFKDYARVLAQWPHAQSKATDAPQARDFIGLGVRAALKRCLDFAHDPRGLYDALVGAAAWNLLHFDRAFEANNDAPVSNNVGWLDFTHGITFANAVRVLCTRYPALWPQGLLQMACFAGRNAAYVDKTLDTAPWQVESRDRFFDVTALRLLDHGQFEYIVAAHLLKTFMAARAEVSANPEAPWTGDVLAGVNRFLNTPVKRRFSLRTARQSLDFVVRED
jgi:nitrite reductase/ring-hydroxylating ferredoxin subunit